MLLHRARSLARSLAASPYREISTFLQTSFAIPTERKPWEKPLGRRRPRRERGSQSERCSPLKGPFIKDVHAKGGRGLTEKQTYQGRLRGFSTMHLAKRRTRVGGGKNIKHFADVLYVRSRSRQRETGCRLIALFSAAPGGMDDRGRDTRVFHASISMPPLSDEPPIEIEVVQVKWER